MKHKFNVKPLSPEMGTPRPTTRPPSLVTPGGSTALKETMKYTGGEVLGITIIHKSCLQPVFKRQDAIDAANMRR
jgi:hypothetical protein